MAERPEGGQGDNTQWLMLARQRMNVPVKLPTELHSLSAISYPHGEPSFAVLEALDTSNYDFNILEDELLSILSIKYEHILFNFLFLKLNKIIFIQIL